MTDLIERAAVAMRKNQFERTRRRSFDPGVEPTEREKDDARAVALFVLQEAAKAVCDGCRNDAPRLHHTHKDGWGYVSDCDAAAIHRMIKEITD